MQPSKPDHLDMHSKASTHHLCDPGQVLNLSVPWIFYLLNGDSARTGLTEGGCELKPGKHLGSSLAACSLSIRVNYSSNTHAVRHTANTQWIFAIIIISSIKTQLDLNLSLIIF